MHFDVIEAIRQKQYKHQQRVSIENGDLVDISISDGNVVVSVEPAEIVPLDD